MWERLAFLAFFAELCLAQNAAIADIRGKHWISPVSPSPSAEESIARQLQARADLANAVPAILDMEKRQDSTANVFVTVLFPEVPTGAPTGVIVPIEITVTGALSAADVPTGFQTPTDIATAVAPTETAVATPAPTTATPQPTTETPTTQPTSSETVQSTTTASSTSITSSSTLSTSTTPRSSSSASRTSSSRTSNTAASSTASSAATSAADHDALSPGAVAGIVIGVVAFVAALALLFLFLMRPSKRKSMRKSSPVYPEEAYLYDPPMAAGGAGAREMAEMHDHETRSLHAQSFGRPASRPPTPPMMGESERQGLLAGAAAGGAVAAGAAARSRRGTMSNQGSPMLRPQMGGGGYAAVPSGDIAEMQSSNPFLDHQDTAYRGSSDAGPSNQGASWPMNPAAPSGLGTPPQTSAGPSNEAAGVARMDSVESRSQTPGSMYRDHPKNQPGGSSDAMRNARRAWGMDD